MTCDCNTNQNNCGCSTDYAPENTIDYYYNQTDPSENKISQTQPTYSNCSKSFKQNRI